MWSIGRHCLTYLFPPSGLPLRGAHQLPFGHGERLSAYFSPVFLLGRVVVSCLMG